MYINFVLGKLKDGQNATSKNVWKVHLDMKRPQIIVQCIMRIINEI